MEPQDESLDVRDNVRGRALELAVWAVCVLPGRFGGACPWTHAIPVFNYGMGPWKGVELVRVFSSDHSVAALYRLSSTGSHHTIHGRILDSEIHVDIGWLWDGGIDVSIGDDEVKGNVGTVAEILPWLQEVIAKHMPDSKYHVERTGRNVCIKVDRPA